MKILCDHRLAPVLLGLLALGLLALGLPAHGKTPTQTPTQTLGAFLAPVSAQASSAQSDAGRTPDKLIDGSGWGKTRPGSGVYVHTSNVSADGSCMWNGDWNSWLRFDLGKPYHVNGVYVWNYNEAGWTTRGVKQMAITASTDGQHFTPVGTFTLESAPGTDDDQGQAIAFPRVVRARYFRWQILSNYRGAEQSGLAEVRFSDAGRKAVPTTPGSRPTPAPGTQRLRAGRSPARRTSCSPPTRAWWM